MSADVMDNIDIISPPVKKINFNGEIIEISFIPLRISLEAMKITDEIGKENVGASDGFEKLIAITVNICSKSNPRITRDWLLDNSDGDMLVEFLTAAVSGGKKAAQEVNSGKSGKN